MNLEIQVKALAAQQEVTNQQLERITSAMEKIVVMEVKAANMNEVLNGFGKRLSLMESTLNDTVINVALNGQKSNTIGDWLSKIGLLLVGGIISAAVFLLRS